MIAKGKVTTGVPALGFRFDDGSACQVRAIIEALEAGIACGLTLHFTSLRTGGLSNYKVPNVAMRRADVHELLAVSDATGTPLSIFQHSNTNWAGYASMTWQQIEAELDPTALREEFGRPVRVYVQPGDAGQNEWCVARRTAIRTILEQHGIDFAIGLVRLTTLNPLISAGAAAVGLDMPTPGYINSSMVQTGGDPWHTGNGIQLLAGAAWRPGQVVDPYSIPDNWTRDLGVSFVPRGAAVGENDPNSGERAWLFGADNNGLGVEGGTPSANGRYTLQSDILKAIGAGLWVPIAVHGDARSDQVVVTKLSAGRGSAGTPAALPGSFSIPHLIDFLGRLIYQGHLRSIPVEQFCEELWSDYEVGTDIIANPGCHVPVHDTGELVCPSVPEIVAPRGMTFSSVGMTTFNASSQFLGFAADGDADARVDDPIVAADVVGRSVAGYLGHPGGFVLRPGAAAAPNSASLGLAFLHPGVWRIRALLSGDALEHVTIANFTVLGHRMRRLAIAGLVDAAAQYMPEFTIVRADRHYIQKSLSSQDEAWIEFEVECKREATPMRTRRFSGLSAVNVPAGDSVVLGSNTVEGARPGAKVWVWAEDAAIVPPRMVTGEVVSPETVELTFHNGTAGIVTLASPDMYVGVEHVLEEEQTSVAVGAGGGDWSYTLQLTIAKDATKEITVSDLHCELIAQR